MGEKQVFKATNVGYFLKSSPWIGKVLSVYPSVINILHPEKYLVSLVMKESQMTVFGIHIASFFYRNDKDLKRESEDIRPGT